MSDVVLVGGNGYLGSYLQLCLSSRGFETHTVDPSAGVSAGTGKITSSLFQTIPPDSKCVFLAWPRKFDQDRMNERSEHDTLSGLKECFDLCAGRFARTLFCSTGQSGLGRYGRSKAEFEERIRHMERPNVGFLRFGTIHGLSPSMRWDLVLNRMILDGIKDGVVRVQGPRVSRAHVSIQEAANAVCMELFERGTGGRSTVCEVSCSMLDLGEAVSSVLGVDLVVSDQLDGTTVSYKIEDVPTDPTVVVRRAVDQLKRVLEV